MKTTRIYQPGIYQPGDDIELFPEAARHVGLVLRMVPQNVLTLFRGDNQEFSASILSVKKQKVMVHIHDVKTIPRESSQIIYLAQCLSKGDRFDWVVQKAVELGVSSIYPIASAHCAIKLDKARLAKKLSLWRAISISACEQCGRNQLPEIHEVSSFKDFVQQIKAPCKLLSSPKASLRTQHIPRPHGPIVFLVGPEGGLSDEEEAFAESFQFSKISFGPRILRTETAAIAGLSILQATFGDV